MPLSSMQVDPRVDGTVAPTLTRDSFTGFNEALAKLAHQAASDTPDASPRAPAPDRSADARISPSPAAATLGPAELSTQIPREQRSLGTGGILARVAILLCVGVCSFWGWRSYGGDAREMIANWASPLGWISARLSAEQPPQMPHRAPAQAAAPAAVATSALPPSQAASQPASPAPSQAASIAQPATTAANEAIAHELAALRQTVEQLAAGQEQLTREIAKLQAEKPQKPPAKKPEKRVPARVSAQGRGSDVFDPAQNPTAPGVPRSLGSIVLRRGSPRRRASPPRQRRGRRKPLLGSRP